MKHTTEPWAYHPHKEQDVSRKGFLIVENVRINAKNIATVHNCIGMEEGEVEANTRLMTVAPQLLKALKDLVALKDWKDTNGKDLHYKLTQPAAWEYAKSIISKLEVNL